MCILKKLEKDEKYDSFAQAIKNEFNQLKNKKINQKDCYYYRNYKYIEKIMKLMIPITNKIIKHFKLHLQHSLDELCMQAIDMYLDSYQEIACSRIHSILNKTKHEDDMDNLIDQFEEIVVQQIKIPDM